MERFFNGIPHPYLLGVRHLDNLMPWKSAKNVSHRPVNVKWRNAPLLEGKRLEDRLH